MDDKENKMTITASMVKTLREKTDAPMMDCKKALTESGGDIEKAIEWMRKKGQASAAKKATRIAAQGCIVADCADGFAAMIEINCETDFVGKDENFKQFCNSLMGYTKAHKTTEIAQLADATLDNGQTVDAARLALVAKIGENIQLRRMNTITSSHTLASYTHGARIAVLVELEGGDEALARDIAMHIAAINPECIHADEIQAETLEKERGIVAENARQSGKPEAVIEKMVEGRMKKFVNEITLLGQSFVKDPSKSVEALLKEHGASVKQFVRYELGEGIEKKEENFADEVMKQVKGE